MTALSDLLTKALILPYLPACLEPGEACYLVGGAPRDFLLGRSSIDFDFATPGEPTNLAKRFSAKINGRWFMMDRTRKQSRVVLKTANALLTYDFAPFRSDTLEDDLRLRDFTINALAVDLLKTGKPDQIYDPLNARGDLQKSLLRACSNQVFEDDPLRVLRGIRLAASLKMKIAPRTFALMRAAAPNLCRVSAERIHSELAQILTVDPSTTSLQYMESLGVMPVLFGSLGDREDFTEGIKRFALVSQRLEAISKALPRAFEGTEYGTELSRLAIIRLAAFLSGCNVLDCNPLRLKQLRFSNNNDILIRSLVGLNSNQIDELNFLKSTGRGRALWVSQLGPAPALSLVYLLCLIDAPEPLFDKARSALDDYFNHVINGRIPDLVNGAWIESELDINQGQLIGSYLLQLRQAEVEGLVLTQEDAYKFLKSLAQKKY